MDQSQLRVTSLIQIYGSNNIQRYKTLAQQFEQIYGSKPDFFARAPGRVNLIGEHIDYMGYGVFPFALEQDCLIGVGVNDKMILEINHVDSSQYQPQNIDNLDPCTNPIFINNYVKYIWAGYQAAVETSGIKQLQHGIQLLVSGNVPQSAGLSSSSSLVVCAGAAILQAIQVPIDNLNRFVENLIKYERLAGTACGGMDQSISTLGQSGQALYIQFDPLRIQEVKLPNGFIFVVANSLTPSTKLDTLGTRYNKRVCECRIALYYILKYLNIKNNGYKTLSQLQEHINLPNEAITKLIKLILQDREYTFNEIEIHLQQKLQDILSDIPQLDTVFQQNKSLKLRNRALHVFEESGRVITFKQVCESPLLHEVKAKLLGDLMNESQKSCSELYECSSQQIEILTNVCLKNGALGSRLTGAGWGGCTVSIVEETKAHQFVQNVIEEYYEPTEVNNFDNVIFITKPSKGACTIDYEQIFNQNN